MESYVRFVRIWSAVMESMGSSKSVEHELVDGSCGFKICTAVQADDVSLQAVRANRCAEAGKAEDDLVTA